jgi:hypothetical protein
MKFISAHRVAQGATQALVGNKWRTTMLSFFAGGRE